MYDYAVGIESRNYNEIRVTKQDHLHATFFFIAPTVAQKTTISYTHAVFYRFHHADQWLSSINELIFDCYVSWKTNWFDWTWRVWLTLTTFYLNVLGSADTTVAVSVSHNSISKITAHFYKYLFLTYYQCHSNRLRKIFYLLIWWNCKPRSIEFKCVSYLQRIKTLCK